MKLSKRYIIVVVSVLLIVFINYLYVIIYIQTNELISQQSEITQHDILWYDKPPKPPYPIDIVYTWAGPTNANNKNDRRSRDNHELKYSLRSIYSNMPWFNHVYIVVSDINIKIIANNLTFINTINLMNVTIISHSDIFNDKTNCINQANSDAIECNLHHIPNLSDYYIYIMDDVFIGRQLSYKYYFILDKQRGDRLIPRMPYVIYTSDMIGDNWWNIFLMKSLKSPYVNTFPCLYNNKIKANEIPFDNKESMMRHQMEHAPHPYYKPDWIMFENKYPKLFQIIESNKKRFKNCQRHEVGIDIHFFRLWLNGTFRMNIMRFKYYDFWYSFLIKYIHTSFGHLNYYSYWVNHNGVRNIDNFKYHLAHISNKKPATFCLNDDYPDDHHQHIKQLLKFFTSYFPHKSHIEK
eukprot:124391_1